MGRFWAVGVGPGDPELLTLKAVNILQRAHVIYHAGPEPNKGRAYEIIHSYLRAEQDIRLIRTEAMSVVSASEAKTVYRPAVDRIAADCRGGLDVAFVTEGDPTLYSTAANVWQLLAELYPDIPIEIIPGVSSITAAAARVGWPLAQKDEMLAIVPAGYHTDEWVSLLETFSGIVLLKPTQVLPHIVRFLETSEGNCQAVYLENLCTPKEWITCDLSQAVERRNYFSVVLLRKKKAEDAWPGLSLRSPGASATPELRFAQPRPPCQTPTGKIWLVGLGPGDAALLTRGAREALESAEVIIGYEGYLKLLGPLSLRAEMVGSPIGAEKQRASQAIQFAGAGRQVALVSSGDAGVYGMGSLLLETAGDTPAVEMETVPGVTAAVAAAALLGAPLGHDFACLSLSDLLTPWPVIERRLAAVGQGDLVLAIYNPASTRRTWQLPRARDILLQHRPPRTPVGLVDKAYRPGMRIWHTTLGELTTAGVGMETTVIIGNSETRLINGRMVTPRGYKSPLAPAGGRSSWDTAENRSDPGREILHRSFAIIERELGPRPFPPWVFTVVRRMIHASGDFDFASTIRYSADFASAIEAAFHARAPIVADTEMVLLGIRTAFADRPHITMVCHLNDPGTSLLAQSAELTRSAAGIRLAASRLDKPILIIGNAPTALEEALHLIKEGWRPSAIIGMPVGFVGVEEAKQHLLEQSAVPYLTCLGRKGGSAVTAAAMNALVEWHQPHLV
jgi:precorrin-2 C(20)-methyltransferase